MILNKFLHIVTQIFTYYSIFLKIDNITEILFSKFMKIGFMSNCKVLFLNNYLCSIDHMLMLVIYVNNSFVYVFGIFAITF